MTDDLIEYGILGGAYAPGPDQIASLFEKQDIRLVIDGPWESTYLNGRKERWPRALDYIGYYTRLYRQWAYRRADGDTVLLQEIDRYVSDLYEWLKQGRQNGHLDDIELEKLKEVREALTARLYEYVPERLIAGGLASIEQLLADIEKTEQVTEYPPNPSPKWYNAEIVRLGLLAEKIRLLTRLVEKAHPENADKYNYLHYLGEVVGEIACYTGALERSRDELDDSKGKIDIQEHFSKIDGEIENARRRIDNHFADLRERLAASKPLATDEIVRAFRQYELSKDISALPPMRQLRNALRKLKEPNSEDTSTLADFIVALGRHIRSDAGYQCGLLDQFSITEVLSEIENLNTRGANREAENESNTRNQAGEVPEKSGSGNDSTRNLVFISYSHEDEKWLDELQNHLKPYIRNELLTTWSDKDIIPGEKWLAKIEAALASAKVGVLLVTKDFLASDFIAEHELKPLLKQAEQGNVQIIWIPVGACSYGQNELKDSQAPIDPAKPLANLRKPYRDKAWVKICEAIKKAVNR